MKIVLDINVLLVSIPKKSIYRKIFDALLEEKFILVISNEILLEYIEIISLKSNDIVANNIAEMLLKANNVQSINVYYKWGLIDIDPDDNKYIDTAIASSCDYLVTNDLHFNVLNQIDFPKVNVVSIDKFLTILTNK